MNVLRIKFTICSSFSCDFFYTINKLSSLVVKNRASIFFFRCVSWPMNRSYLVHFLRKINAERAVCARGKKGESGGEFDSLSTPPPAFPRNSRMRRKKARPLRVSFHSSGFVYPLPDKKALLARLSFVTDIPFVRGSRSHHHCCRFRH